MLSKTNPVLKTDNKLPHPLQKSNTNKVHMVNIFKYSPRKKKANGIEEYSTLYPATNSASASGKSNGALLVSAKIHINIKIALGSIQL